MAKTDTPIKSENNLPDKKKGNTTEPKIRRDVLGKYFCFTGIKDTVTVQLNPENTYFKITKLEVRPLYSEGTSVSQFNPIRLSWTLHVSDFSYRTEHLHELANHSFYHYPETVDINKVISFNDDNSHIVFNYDCDEKYKCEVHLYYETIDKRVDLKNPFEEFSDHIKLKDNVKILFSGPFGQGKTTFLNHYFEKNEIKYEVFKLYPVNYAVSHNEDIFKYIKAEILFQLMGKDVQFDKLEFSYSEAAYSYFSQNIDKIVSPLLSILPKVGESAAKVFDKIFELSKAIKNHKSELDINDEKDALKYIKELYDKEGSIFEDNFYTQLIRQLLQQHKEKYKKENVLVIDDIDRMDPDHIFRIFNVFSANFDSSEYRLGLSNKFGFDKIILVCDLNNIKKIFKHRYGNATSFDGYLGKYFNKTPFYYDNRKAMETITKEIVYGNGTRNYRTFIGDTLNNILKDLISCQEITLRDLFKLKDGNIFDIIDGLAQNYSERYQLPKDRFVNFVVIGFLEKLFDIESLIEKFKRCRQIIKFNKRVNYDYLVLTSLPAFGNFIKFKEDKREFSFNQKNIQYNIDILADDFNTNYEYYIAKDAVLLPHNVIPTFNEKDFYELLILSAEKYREF